MTGRTRAKRDSAVEMVGEVTRTWTRAAGKRIPPAFAAHARAAVREGVLAVASLADEVLRAVEAQTGRARRRVERIPVRTPRPRRTARRRG